MSEPCRHAAEPCGLPPLPHSGHCCLAGDDCHEAEWLAVHLASCDRHPPRYGQPTLPEEEQHA